MKQFLFLLITTCILSFRCDTSGKDSNKLPSNLHAAGISPVLLELFTSEGCSSCPPADRLLPELQSIDPNVIAISYHVDYWNYLGWSDQFSKPEFSDRQKEYASIFHLESIYTPQLIVNGKHEFVGSNRARAESVIQKVLKEKQEVDIKINDIKPVDDKIEISFALDGNWQQTNLFAAVIQKHAEINVKAGENKGIHLTHTNIVRSFEHVSSQHLGKLKMIKPRDLKEDNWLVVLFCQRKDMSVVGIASWEQLVGSSNGQ